MHRDFRERNIRVRKTLEWDKPTFLQAACCVPLAAGHAPPDFGASGSLGPVESAFCCMSYFLPCGTQEELWLPFPFLHSGESPPALQRIIAAGQCQVQPSVWRLEERAGDEGCGKLLWGDLGRGKSGKGQRLLNLLPTLSKLSLGC